MTNHLFTVSYRKVTTTKGWPVVFSFVVRLPIHSRIIFTEGVAIMSAAHRVHVVVFMGWKVLLLYYEHARTAR